MPEPKLPYYQLPAGLRDRVRSSLRDASTSESASAPAPAPVVARPPTVRWTPAAWMVGVAAALVLLVPPVIRARADRVASQNEVAAVIDGHLRALVPGHLTDVVSTDQHTVKPWFAGRLPFSPPVRDLAKAGFPLVGGRVDVLDGEAVAALVYSRRGHIVNLFIRPIRDSESARPQAASSRGINVVTWTHDRTRFWAVSDLRMVEVEQLRDLLSSEDVGNGVSPQ